jgi:glycerol kinase
MDLLNAMRQDGASINTVRVDGGMVNNDWLSQYLADILDIVVQRPRQTETTALGAAYLAGLQVGYYNSLDDLRGNWQQEQEFRPSMDSSVREKVAADWADAIRRTRSQSG